MKLSILKIALGLAIALSIPQGIFAEGKNCLEKFASYPAFSCSLAVYEIRGEDTLTDRGFLAVSDRGFFAQIGGDCYLQTEPDSILNWSEGADAIKTPAPTLFGLRRFTKNLDSLFALQISENCATGKNTSEDFAIKRIKICFTSKCLPDTIELEGSYSSNILIIPFKKSTGKIPDKVFSLPKGTQIIRGF